DALGLKDQAVAVRSSGLDEDSAQNSFAGQFSSFLFRKGLLAVVDAIKRCWASGFSERALAYRIERGIQVDNIRIGVLIQKMVEADAAGVAFSRNPIHPLDRANLLVSSVWGLGEGLVSGELDADHFEVQRESLAIKAEIADKQWALRRRADGGLIKGAVSDAQRKAPSLSDAQVRAIAQLALKLEAQLGVPQDCEWAIEQGRVQLVQTRPITNLPPDVFHDRSLAGDRATLWDNSNIIESYAGVTSPLTFSFASHAYREVYISFSRIMGVPEAVIEANETTYRNTLGLVRGRFYYNLLNWYRMLLMMPGGATNKAFLETMMGVRQSLKPEHASLFDFTKEAPRYPLHAKIGLLLKTIHRFRRMPEIVRSFRAHFDAVYTDARSRDFNAMSLNALADFYLNLDAQLLKRWQAPIINDYLCMLFFGLLKKLVQSWIAEGDEASSLQNDLLCGQGDVESTEPTKMLMRIAAKIDSGPTPFRNWFLTTEPAQAWKDLPARSAEIHEAFAEFLDRYGFRCINELKLEEPDLHDDPSFALGAVANYVRTRSYSIDTMVERELEIRHGAEAEAAKKLSGWKKRLFFWVLKHARIAVKTRESLRFDRTKIFGIVRHLFRAIGRRFAALGLIDTEHDVFYLTVEEVLAHIEGRAVALNLRALIAQRRAEFDVYRRTPAPPDRFVTTGAAGLSFEYPAVLADGDLMLGEDSDDSDPKLLKGTPCCPGTVEGIVRVVSEFKDAQNLNGEILVTERTDPGWVPLYPSCSGLLIERGSLLSHSAVVARELGLPTIVGVRGGLLKKLKTGQRVRVDAGRGEIRILD
ncbi:MAG TPA: PEP/pyruvate-binding domain-containing protein, partial [Steroidobacteraceae bacterium]|nr:PEP/pyruvate-binding domain-containing protein [Steroidobacteraceae bacterium]